MKFRKNQTQQHQIDPVFKQVLIDKLTPFAATLQTEVEVSRLPRKIDAVITIESTREQQRIRNETPFSYFLQWNQVEFKGRRDPLTPSGYHLIHARKHLLLGEEKISPPEMAVTIVCASKPLAVFAYTRDILQEPFTAVEAGYYQGQGYPIVYLIVVNELPITAKNYPLLLFAASERKFREFLEQVVALRDATYLRYAYEVRPRITREVLTMAGISATLSQEDLKFMAQDVGRELMAFLPPEELLAKVPDKERLAGLSSEGIITALSASDLWNNMNTEQRTALLELLRKVQVIGHKMNGRTHSS